MKKYTKPELEVVNFATEEIAEDTGAGITPSGNGDTNLQ